MPTGMARANGIDICYETFGDPSDPALLLVMGFGVQMIEWEPEYCQRYADAGFYVIRYDNRDVGLSTHFDGHEVDMEAVMRGDASSAAYTLNDMADDGVGLLDALGIDRAHILGASMGGMIVQTIAIRHPDRVLSLCSVMSTTGARGVGRADPAARAALVNARPDTRDEYIAASIEASRLMCGGGFPFDEDKARQRMTAAYDRAYYPEGKNRQAAAIAASGDRTEALNALRIPTVVIHGSADKAVGVTGGEATAAAIPGATFVVIPGMGHEQPSGAQPLIVEAFVANARRAATAPDAR